MQIDSQGGVSSEVRVGPLEDSSFQWLRLWRVHRLCRSVRNRGALEPNVSVSQLSPSILLRVAGSVVELDGKDFCVGVSLGIGGVFRLCCVWRREGSVLVSILGLSVSEWPLGYRVL